MSDKENRVDLKTSVDFRNGYDAASKAKQLIMDAQEAEIARLRAALEEARTGLLSCLLFLDGTYPDRDGIAKIINHVDAALTN